MRPNPSAHLVGVRQRGDRPLVPNGRKRIAAIAATLITLMTALVMGIGVATPSATAKPDLETVKKKVEKLDRQAEQASERYNDARIELKELQACLLYTSPSPRDS